MKQVLKEKLQYLNEDEVLLQAIQEVFNERIEMSKPSVNDNDNNTKIGEKYRAYEQAKDILVGAFVDINGYANYKKNKGSFNKSK